MPQYLYLIQVAVLIVIGLFFLVRFTGKRSSKKNMSSQAKQQEKQLKALRQVTLHVPLSELCRPKCFDEIVGQQQAIDALRAAMCGQNPQHVLIYGPAGVGKTCAARLVLEHAKMNPLSPFSADAKLIEIDGGSIRYDERCIADPLLGSVHDPIYQGAGAFGAAGIPQPRPGAVTKAHGGILFIDEIGELNPHHVQRLLKVLEDRCVYFESSYYSSLDKNIPKYIHDIFANGMPADFRLIGATTKPQNQIPSAIRSRCIEIFFRQLYRSEVIDIAKKSAKTAGFVLGEKAETLIGDYAFSGRDAVCLVQLSAGIARESAAKQISTKHVGCILESGKYTRRQIYKLGSAAVGCVNALAVCSSGSGTVVEIETAAILSPKPILKVTGLIDEEQIVSGIKTYKRKSTAKSSVENVLTVLRKTCRLNPDGYYLHINIPGGVPVDGPSAGAAIAVSLYSAVYNRKVRDKTVVTGELSINGRVRAVGGVYAKVLAAKHAGAKLAVVPSANLSEAKNVGNIAVKGVSHISELIDICFSEETAVIPEGVLIARGS